MAEPDASIYSLMDYKGRYRAVVDDLERILTTLNPISENPTLTTLLEDFLVSLELWGNDIDIEDGTLISAARNDPLAKNVRVIFEYLDEQLVHIKGLEEQFSPGSEIQRPIFSDLSNKSLKENFMQITLSLNNLVPAVRAAHSLESRKGLFADVANTMAIDHWLATSNQAISRSNIELTGELYRECTRLFTTIILDQEVLQQIENTNRYKQLAQDMLAELYRFEGWCSVTDGYLDAISMDPDNMALQRALATFGWTMINVLSPIIKNDLSSELALQSIRVEESSDKVWNFLDGQCVNELSTSNPKADTSFAELIESLSNFAAQIRQFKTAQAVLKSTLLLADPTGPLAAPLATLTPQFWYTQMISDKFQATSGWLAERLGVANWARHTYLREENAASLVNHTMAHETDRRTTSGFQQDSGYYSGTRPGTLYERSRSHLLARIAVQSQASHQSFNSSHADDHAGRRKVPEPPVATKSYPTFECQFCHQEVLSTIARAKWKRHVFRDLRPYICTIKSCTTETQTFATRSEWERHEVECHGFATLLQCNICESLLETANEFVNHFENVHGKPDSRLSPEEFAPKHSVSRIQKPEDRRCPFCKQDKTKRTTKYTTHVAKHMEDIALAALPPEVDDTAATDPNSANKNEAPSVHSNGTSSSLSDLMVYPISRTSTVDYSESLLRASITRNVDNDLLKDHVGMPFHFDGLDPAFQKLSAPQALVFFVPGRVFATLWWDTGETAPTSLSLASYREQAYAKVFRFIVVTARPAQNYSNCIQISTHRGHGASKKGLDQGKHVVVYTGDQPPEKLPTETKMHLDPIQIQAEGASNYLDPLSRIDLAKIFQMKHHGKVKNYGMVSRSHLKRLEQYVRQCQ